MSDEQQQQQPTPDALDLLAAQLVSMQALLSVLGGSLYAAIVHVNALMAARGGTPIAAPAQPGRPATGQPSQPGMRISRNASGQLVAEAFDPSQPATFNRRRPNPPTPPADATQEQLDAYTDAMAANVDGARITQRPVAAPRPEREAETITSDDVGALPEGIVAPPSPETTEGAP